MTDVQTITVTVDNINELPVITSSSTVDSEENQTDVITVTVSLDANDTYSFSISGGEDQALFSIDEATGELAFTAAPDFENSLDTDNDYIVEVTVTDGGGLTAVQTITVSATNVVEFSDNAPIISSEDTVSVFPRFRTPILECLILLILKDLFTPE